MERWRGEQADRRFGAIDEQRKVDFIRGRAAFLDSRTLKIEEQGGERRLVFENAIIATGSRPAAPRASRSTARATMDSTAALELERHSENYARHRRRLSSVLSWGLFTPLWGLRCRWSR